MGALRRMRRHLGRRDKPKPADDSAAGLIAAPRSAAVETIVDSNPTTPGQLLKAALLLADLDRLDLAKKYLAQLAASKPDENTLAESAGQIDPEMLLRVSATSGFAAGRARNLRRRFWRRPGSWCAIRSG